jgi:cytochrome c-type biogenesis protein CcmE
LDFGAFSRRGILTFAGPSDTLRRMSKGVQVAGGATLIAAMLGWYALTNLEAGAAFTYYQSLHEFRASPQALSGAHSRVHGYVAQDSIRRDVEGKRVWFAVQNDPPHAAGSGAGTPLEVEFASLETPDMFKDGAEVVIEGRMLADASRFEADRVLAKCPSKFEGAAGEATGPPALN